MSRRPFIGIADACSVAVTSWSGLTSRAAALNRCVHQPGVGHGDRDLVPRAECWVAGTVLSQRSAARRTVTNTLLTA
jgi:hypothetical protein